MKETLEEALRKFSPLKFKGEMPYNKTDMIEFAKSQQEQNKNLYSEEDMKQFAFVCVANFLSNNNNKVEMSLVEVITDRNDEKFEQFKK